MGPFHTIAPTWWGVWVERQVNKGQEWKQCERERARKRRTCRKTDPESILIISAAAAAWLADVREEWTRPTVMLQSKGAATIKGWGGRPGLAVHGCLCVWRDVPGQKITSADGAVAHVAWLAGTQVSSDGVGADGVLITQILAGGTLVVLCRGRECSSEKCCACRKQLANVCGFYSPFLANSR